MTKAELLHRMEAMPDDAEVQVVYLSATQRATLDITLVTFIDNTIILVGDPQ